MLNRLLKDNKGTALLVALLIMGILTAISLVLSVLVLREARVTRDLIDSGKAYYAAESGVEIALYKIKNSLPGWEPDDQRSDGFVSFKVDQEATTIGELKVDNRCNAYPCFEGDFDPTTVDKGNEKAFYDVLELNESITIPLFVVENDGTEVPVGDFVVEFFAPFNPSTDLKFLADGGGDIDRLSGWDVLRWKVFGIRKDEPQRTQTISDFTSIKTVQFAEAEDGDGIESTNATIPSWFGSLRDGCSLSAVANEPGARYTDLIKCFAFAEGSNQPVDIQAAEQQNILQAGTVEDGEEKAGEVSASLSDLTEFDQISDIYDVVCWPWQAREYYEYDYSYGVRFLPTENVHPCYDIDKFMDKHKLKYLSLTNLMNPAVFEKNGANSAYSRRDKLSRLFYRVEFFEDGEQGTDAVKTGNESVREFAEITSKGYSGNNAQTIDVRIKRDSFMPVFNFSLYSTYKKDRDDVSGYDYYYGDQVD